MPIIESGKVGGAVKLVAVVGKGRFDTARNISIGLKEAGVPTLSLSNSEYLLNMRPRPNVGSAIDGFGEAHGEEQIILTSADRIPRMIGIDKCIIVLCGEYEPFISEVPFDKNRRVYVIVNSGARVAAPMLGGCTVITCGMGAKDSVTLSSVRFRSAVACIQRQIYTFGGRVIEPCEYPVPYAVHGDVFGPLALFCVMLLCDYI